MIYHLNHLNKNRVYKLIDFYLLNKQLNLCCWCYPKRCHGEIIKNYLEEQIRIQYENFSLR